MYDSAENVKPLRAQSKRSDQTSTERQRGGSLVEVLIATALVGILLHGAATLVNRATSVSTDQQLLNIAVDQMVQHLQTNPDVCNTAPVISLPNGQTLTASTQGCNTTTQVQIGNTLVSAPTPVRLSVDSPQLGGQVAVGGTFTGTH